MMTRSARMNGVNEIRNHGGPDLINQLPDEVLCCITSSLSIDEAVRSSILSKRWKPLWKYSSSLDFDWTHMMKPLSQLEKSISGKISLGPNQATEKSAHKYGKLVHTMLCHHLGDLTNCRFKHFPQSLALGDVEGWVEFVVEKHKRLTSLSLECVPSFVEAKQIFYDPNQIVKVHFQPRIFSNLCSLELTSYVLDSSVSSAFESCEKLKILKLKKMVMKDETINGILTNCLGLEKFSLIESVGFKKLKITNSNLQFLELMWLIVSEIDIYVEDLQVVVLDSINCPAKGLNIYALNLRTFCSGCNPIAQRCFGKNILKTQDILENCSDLFESHTTNIFRNLLKLSIELDLNNIREAMALSFILRSCIYLETLEVTIPVEEGSNSSNNSDDCALPFPKSMFWERQETYNCINHMLKFTIVKGFTGKEQELKFVKHLITRATMMRKISIICDSAIVDEATDLLSLPGASVYLSIVLKSKNKNKLVEIAEVKHKTSHLMGNYYISRNI